MTWYVFIDTYYLNNNLTFYSFEKNCSMSIWLFSIWINQAGLFSFHLIWLIGLQCWILSKHLVGKLFYWENFNQINYFTSASGQWFKPRAAFSQYNTTIKPNQPSWPEMVHPKRIMTLVLSFLFTLQIFIILVLRICWPVHQDITLQMMFSIFATQMLHTHYKGKIWCWSCRLSLNSL